MELINEFEKDNNLEKLIQSLTDLKEQECIQRWTINNNKIKGFDYKDLEIAADATHVQYIQLNDYINNLQSNNINNLKSKITSAMRHRKE